LFLQKRPEGKAQRKKISLVDIRRRSNKVIRAFLQKPSGRQIFCLRPALARASQPANRNSTSIASILDTKYATA
jgi:hypothetical protein